MSVRSQKLRSFYACLVAGEGNPRVREAFAAVPREPFVGPGPWLVMGNAVCYADTPTDDPAFVYQDVLVALDVSRGLNIGLPSAHAVWLAAADVEAGETVIQVGTGTGYYSAILAELVGNAGRVHAYEINQDLAARAADNVKPWPQVDVRATSGIADNLPKADVIYVCAGIAQPSWAWIDALRPGGRLLFPLQPERGLGGMLMITRPQRGVRWPARFVSRARFIACEGNQDAGSSPALIEAFAGQWNAVRSFLIGAPQDETCWFAGDGWWLSTAAPDASAPD